MKTNQQYFDHIRKLISEAKIDAAIKELQALFEHTPHLSEVIQQSSRWKDLGRQIRKGTVSHEHATVNRNKITDALLEFMTEIEIQHEVPSLREEMAQAVITIANSKNVMMGNISAGGDLKVHFGDNITIIQEGKGDKLQQKAFNEYLTKELITAIAPHYVSGRKFADRVASIKNWEKEKRISSKAKEIIAYRPPIHCTTRNYNTK